MTQNTNPHERTKEVTETQMQRAFLVHGLTTTAPDPQGDGVHHDFVQEVGVSVDAGKPVMPTVHGDFYVPPENSPVYIASTSKHEQNIVGVPVPKTKTPKISPGERILSHPLSTASIRYNSNGSLVAKDDGGSALRLASTGLAIMQSSLGSYVRLNSGGGVDAQNQAGDASLHVKDDGTILLDGNGSTVEVAPDGDVIINGGSTATVTDVTISDTNSNGGATELTIHRNDTVKVPSGNTTTTSP